MISDKQERIHKDVENLHQNQTEKEQITVAIYARTSSPNQRFNYSLDEQIRACRERCDIMGWKVRFIFKEEAVSAKDTNRPMFGKMIDRAKESRFDVIIFWRLDRLCRSLLDAVRVEKELGGYGVALHSVTEQIDTTTSVGRFNFRNLASAAELERDLIKERAKMGMHAMAMKHKWPNKKPPLGYNKNGDGKLVVNEEEAELVKRIFYMYIKERSMPQVAFLLNKEGIKTKEGRKWSVPSVKKIIDNELYIGNYSVAGVEDYVEEYKIVEEELFNKATGVRHRFKKCEGKKEPMPEDRKKGTVDKIFDEYFEFLSEVEDESEAQNMNII